MLSKTTNRALQLSGFAALAFATDVLGFSDPAIGEGTTEGDEAEYALHATPTTQVPTRIHLHHTGELRGWVVTAATSPAAYIDTVDVGPDGVVTITGSAVAFEATLAVQLLDLEGNLLQESFTMAGSTELGPSPLMKLTQLPASFPPRPLRCRIRLDARAPAEITTLLALTSSSRPSESRHSTDAEPPFAPRTRSVMHSERMRTPSSPKRFCARGRIASSAESFFPNGQPMLQ